MRAWMTGSAAIAASSASSKVAARRNESLAALARTFMPSWAIRPEGIAFITSAVSAVSKVRV
jgi:hypothetical protein